MEGTHVQVPVPVPTSMPNTLDVTHRPRQRSESVGEVKFSQNEGSAGGGEDRWNYHERHNYKRKKSFGGGCSQDPTHPTAVDGNYVPPNKKNRFYRRQPSVLPSKFLLGGNINDPLNLNSLGNSDNAVTPHTSPCPVPPHRVGEIPIFIPKNPDDPLGLRCDDDIETLQDMIAGVRSNQTKHRTRHRRKSTRKRNDSECSVDTIGETEGEDLALAISLADESDNEEGRNRTASFNRSNDESVQEISTTTGLPRADEGQVYLPPPPPPNPVTSIATATEKSIEPATPSDDSPIQYNFDENDPISDMQGITIQVDPPAGEIAESANQIHVLPPFSPPPKPPNFLEPRIPPKSTAATNISLPGPGRSGQIPPQQIDPFRKRARHNKLDPIVSPVIPQPGQKRNRHYNPEKQKNESSASKQQHPNVPNIASGGPGPGPSTSASKSNKFRSKDEIFQYGNYKRYYGYRNPNPTGDPRLSVFNKEWFSGKDVLDIGCNIGHITLSIARDFGPKRILGIDIDQHLIEIAKKNIVHYVGNRRGSEGDNNNAAADSKFPKSFLSVYGPLNPPRAKGPSAKSALFPANVKFQQENYVLDSDELLECVREEYDVILCLSLTKWIHLNFGDDGLKRFFRRGFYHLRPGGLYIVEPQPWSSYRRKMKLTERIANTSKTIKFFPDQFQDFLLKEVGFTSVQNLGMSSHHIKGFQRPILVFTKGASASALPLPSSSSTTTDPNTNITRTDQPTVAATETTAQKDCT